MTDVFDYLQSASTAYTEAATGGDGLPRIHWFNGDPKMRTRGTFWMTQRTADDHGVTPTAPWKPVTRRFDSGAEEAGFETAVLKIAVVRVRTADIVFNDGMVEYIPRPPRNAPKPPGWSLHVECLCYAQGVSGTTQPVVWTSKRVKTSMAMLTIFRELKRDLFDPLRKTLGKPVPPWTLWIPIAGQVDERNAPVYEQTKGRVVTPPRHHLGNGSEELRATASRLFVGKPLMEAAEAAYAWYQSWQDADMGAGTVAPPAAMNGGGHNTPKPVTDEDFAIPF